MASEQSRVRREAVGVFKTAEALQEAIDELLASGFDYAVLNLMASERAVEEKLGHKYRKVEELEDDTSVPRVEYIAPESIGEAEGALIGGLLYIGAGVGAVLASAGTLAAIITAGAIGGGAGALIGSVLAKLVGDHHAHYLQEQLDHGGLLLWVGIRDEEHEKRATEILKKHSGLDVHVHSISLR
ncbi:MAG: hypothetical protein WAK01_16685 [Methylocystis sp.]